MVTETKTLQWAVPEQLKIPPDPLRARIDFHNQACTLTLFEGDLCYTKIVSASDVAHTLAQGLSMSTGLLPENVLWWRNTAAGPVTAIYQPPKIWRLALLEKAMTAPRRFYIPMPGFIFLCMPASAPWVYAVRSRPRKQSERVYRAPLFNVYDNGKSCAGNHKYPANVNMIIDSFFRSFFNLDRLNNNCSKKFPSSILKLWESLEGKRKYPLDDLIEHGTVKDLIEMEMQ